MVILHVDEVQNITDEHTRSQLLVALGDALTHEEPATAPGGVRMDRALPIAVYLTGLPEFADMAGARPGATFARRFQTTFLGAIDDEALMTALQPFVTEGWPVANDAGGTDRVFMEPKAQRAIVDLARGEPFLFQLAGERTTSSPPTTSEPAGRPPRPRRRRTYNASSTDSRPANASSSRQWPSSHRRNAP